MGGFLSGGFCPVPNQYCIEAKSIPLTHIYMTTHFPGLVHALQKILEKEIKNCKTWTTFQPESILVKYCKFVEIFVHIMERLKSSSQRRHQNNLDILSGKVILILTQARLYCQILDQKYFNLWWHQVGGFVKEMIVSRIITTLCHFIVDE